MSCSPTTAVMAWQGVWDMKGEMCRATVGGMGCDGGACGMRQAGCIGHNWQGTWDGTHAVSSVSILYIVWVLERLGDLQI